MTVVHCRKHSYTHYIGRPSPFGNRFSHLVSHVPGTIKVDTREQAIAMFEKNARRNARLLALIKALPEDAVLGCWCRPDSCHGDVIITLWKELHGKS